MTIEKLKLAFDERFKGTDFIVSDIGNAGGYEKNDLIKIYLKSWQNENYEFHYEIQKSNPKGIFELRIDCHFYPYSPYKEGAHSTEEHGELTGILKQIAAVTEKVMPAIRVESRFRKNSLWGVKWQLNEQICFEQIICIIYETRPLIDKIVKDAR